MSKNERLCVDCRDRPALTPQSHGKMRLGWVHRKGHDPCRQCFRGALAVFARYAA